MGKHAVNDKREALIQAAILVFSKKSYKEATIDEIAKVAGVAKGTVYLYFSNKLDLFIEMIRWVFQQYRLELAKRVPPNGSVTERIQMHLVIRVEIMNMYRPLLQLRVDASTEAEAEFRERVCSEVEQMMEVFRRLIEEGIVSGEFRPVNAKVAASILRGAIYDLVFSSFFDEQMVGEEDVRQVCDIVFQGMIAPQN